MPGEVLVGRDAELAAIEALLDRRDGLHGLVLVGEPGVGKTRLWLAGLEAARARGARVLTTRPTGVDAELGFAGLTDVLDPVAEELLPELPAPQRRALAVALARADAGVRGPDDRAVAAAVLGALRRLARDTRVVLAVDDLQWLDPASARVIEFALRRLAEEDVTVLATLRAPEPAAVDLGVVLGERLTRIELGGLSVAAVYELVAARSGRRLPRSLLLRVHETSGGNPFFALELVRALGDGPLPAPGEPLPVPGDLKELLRARLAALPATARDALLLAAAASRPNEAMLAAAGVRRAPLELAVAAGVVEVAGDDVRFTHPLLADTALADALPTRRRAAHRRLAAAVAEPEEHARHLALAARSPSERVAAALDRAVEHAARRGATAAAAELAELAVTAGRTPLRVARAAELMRHSGDLPRARALLEAAIAEAPAGPERGELRWHLAAAWGPEDGLRALELFHEAEREAAGDDRLRGRIAASLAGWIPATHEGLDAAEASAARAVELAERTGDTATLARALALLGQIAASRGRPLPRAQMERAVALEEAAGPPDVDEDGGPSIVFAEHLLLEDPALGAELAEALVDRARGVGDAGLTTPLRILADARFDLGQLAGSLAVAVEALDAAVQTGRELAEPLALAAIARVRGAFGTVDEARALLDESLELALARGRGGRYPRGVQGELEVAAGDWQAAWDALEPALAGIVPFGLYRADQVVDAIEALAALGRVADARPLVDGLRPQAAEHGTPLALTVASRSEGVVAEAEDDLETAAAALLVAVAHAEAGPRPLDLGRALLCLGSVQRRRREKAAARTTLRRAEGVFASIGHVTFAQRAREEVRRIGGRTAPAAGLSATEERIAQLVAAGRTNAEVAAELHLSRKTVEWNLSKIYRKLGVRSRAELAARRAQIPGSPRL
jgi:DNA-binding CsgD family transcriptional regulator